MRKHWGCGLLLLLVSSCAPGGTGGSSSGSGQPTAGECTGCQVVRHVRVMDAHGVQEDRRVAWKEGLVVEVAADNGTLSGVDREWDGTGRTLLPGLSDMHVHLPLQSGGPDVGTPLSMPRNLMAHLFSGVTRVMDMGGPLHGTMAVRDKTLTTDWLAPRLHATGPFFTAALGHPCLQDYSLEDCLPTATVEEAGRWLDTLQPFHPDLVKLVVEPGLAPAGPFPSLETAALLPAVAHAVAQHNLRAAVHVTRVEDALAAQAAGAAVLAHIPVDRDLTPAEATLLSSMSVITTLSFFDAVDNLVNHPNATVEALVADCADPGILASFSDAGARASLVEQLQPFVAPYAAYRAHALHNAKVLFDAGARLVAGTDAGNLFVFHGAGLHRELRLLVEAGLTPAQALETATSQAAALMQDNLNGFVAVGMEANLLLVEGNPALDIARTALVANVWRRGEAISRARFTSHAQPNVMVAHAVRGGVFAACISDEECLQGHVCNRTAGYCEKNCQPNLPSSCPAGFACTSAGGTSPWVCAQGDGCSPLGQDCPHAAEFQAACLPVDADAAFCLRVGPRADGETCALADENQRCVPGLVCHRDNRCHPLCDVTTMTCSGPNTCQDQQAVYGDNVGLCLP